MRHFFYFIVLISGVALAQNNAFSIEASVLRGNTLAHKEDMYHLIQGHPEGLMLNYTVKTYGKKEWQRVYNFPDYGAYFLYQDFNSQPLGQAYALGGFYNFYFLNRHLQLRISQGIALVTNPYDKFTNSKNKAFGTPILDNTNLGLTYDNQTLLKPIGFHAGLMFTHYSNGRVKSPNSGINTYLLNIGLNYNLDKENPRVTTLDSTASKKNYRSHIYYNFVFRTGINESPIIRSGQRPFYHLGFYGEKRLNRKSALQLGTDLFLTESFKDYIKYYSVAYPEKHIDADTDYKRVGIFVGHELFINKVSLETQVGYYVYQPFKKDIAIYDRLGMKYNFNERIFASFTIKTHMFLAEALEFGVGVRL
ncbi:acyloxyacyl hydrolase [Flavobacterium sp. XGLA_31]|uniref:acyloxyacyl hydrolase n=1 Tax=Flavobacterium sp. XGLA_31 TaxID=3447666 RepID=UPI003F2E614E